MKTALQQELIQGLRKFARALASACNAATVRIAPHYPRLHTPDSHVPGQYHYYPAHPGKSHRIRGHAPAAAR